MEARRANQQTETVSWIFLLHMPPVGQPRVGGAWLQGKIDLPSRWAGIVKFFLNA